MGGGGIDRYVKRDPRTGVYRYYRRIPTLIPQDPAHRRTHIRHSLKTKDLQTALATARRVHESVEALWSDFLEGKDTRQSWDQHDQRVARAQAYGYVYKPLASILSGPLDEIVSRTLDARDAIKNPAAVAAILGAEPPHNPRISEVWELYASHGKAALAGMSPGQLSAHETSRRRALTYLQDQLGDVGLADITRTEVLKFRDWWMGKVETEGLRAYTANRSFTDIKGMLAVVDAALRTSFHAVWEKVSLPETNKTKLRKRPMFNPDWVQDRFLAAGALDSLNLNARLIVYVMIETGMRLGEVCNLRPQDIRLADAVPHVEVAERDDRRQKTEYSIRRIPLVGVALWALRQAPAGFPRYADNADSASAAINKQITALKLRPSPRHTIYSLRHTFQFRIENAGASDRMQADLMGHEFGRPLYGDGPEMKRRQDLLDRIKFTWLHPTA
ncbi:tyrosine-type recombinase/integrase [Ancylobacter sonchi]|uniref:site-specific integrase n=1 Tax=Ancylobacter sonchi TaxID=1937790 RepID=UPI001BD1C3AE|nr:site-specific integrase [Ancylobacter sonchi]MBS7532152.1 tyrosine-type recombinase/integrase [Ancylobacter sonchi]